jgi:hypothetical protein
MNHELCILFFRRIPAFYRRILFTIYCILFRVQYRNLVIQLSSDGAAVFGGHSTWFVLGRIINLPPSLRSKYSSMLLIGMLEGPGAPKHLEHVNRIITDDVRAWDKPDGQTVRDYTRGVAGGESFQCRVRALNHVADLPAQAKVFNSMGIGALSACGFCNVRGTWLASIQRTAYDPEPARSRDVAENVARRRRVQKLIDDDEPAARVEAEAKATGVWGWCAWLDVGYIRRNWIWFRYL